MLNLSNRNAVILGMIVVITIMLPYIILGEDAFITIHDFLDSNPVHVKTILSLGLIGDPDGILPVLDGVPSQNYVPLIPIDIKTILYILLPLYWAIVCNIFFVRLVAFLGMYMLCYNYIIKGNALYSLLVSVLFCLIPFYADYGLSSAGVPLFLYCAFNLEHKRRLLLSYVLLVFFASNSSFALVGAFLCFLWGGWIIYKWLVERAAPNNHIVGIMLLVIVYLFVNISLIYNFFFPSDVISHRVEFLNSGSISDDLLMVLGYLFMSQYHAGGYAAFVILLIILLIFIKNWSTHHDLKQYVLLYFGFVLLVFLGRIIHYIPFKLFSIFQFDRFYFLYPTLCFVLLAKALSIISIKKWASILIYGFPIMCSILIFDGELRSNTRRLIGDHSLKSPSYSQFYDKELFSKIRDDLGSDKPFNMKVVSIGMFPSVAEMNSFYTLDSYVFSYSVEYKHKFRKVISKELDKDDSLKSYFDNWGSRCYIFSSELGKKYIWGKSDNKVVEQLEIDTNALKELGCRYILSAVDIKNYKDLNLSYINSYTTDQSFWNIRVYKLN